MSLTILETINWPGEGLTARTKKVTGDDRFGFDESSGTAWVMDGATDLGPFRIFERKESDAAWMAEAINRELIAKSPSGDVRTYFSEILGSVRKRAAKETRVALDTAPRSVWPIASGMWMWNDGMTTHFARLGDCVALIKPAEGPVEVLTNHAQSELESRTSRELNAMSPENRIKGLQDIRAAQNTEPNYALFGLSEHAVDNLHIETRSLPEDSHVLIMSDGLWRVVDPYAMMNADEMMDFVLAEGVEAMARKMRLFERAGSQDAAARIKKTDDACGVLTKIS